MKTLFGLTLLLFAQLAGAEEVLPLYAGAIPNAIDAPDEEALREPQGQFAFLLNVSRPTLTVYLPDQADANGAAVVIFPGGGYIGLSIVKEGRDTALAFNKMGVAAFVVKYRMPSPSHMQDRTTGPLQDAQQAIRVVRTRAKEWHVNPDRVGIIGFSAGGHLAATAATLFATPVLPDKNAISTRPDFVILGYPVISMSDALAHVGSRSNLLGDSPTPETLRRYSPELNVTAQTPPTFLFHAADDKTVNVLNSVRMFEALQAQKIPVEMHIYPRGGHGFGLENATTQDRWIDRCRNWMVAQGILASR